MQAHHFSRTKIMDEPRPTQPAHIAWHLIAGCAILILLVGVMVLIGACWPASGSVSEHRGTQVDHGAVLNWLGNTAGAGFLPQDAAKTWKPGDPGHLYKGQWLPNTPWGFHPGGPVH